MDQFTISAASGLRARIETLEMLANNIANANTAGFKLDREGYGLYRSDDAWASHVESLPEPATLPVVERHWTDFGAGAIQTTGAPFDFALSGRGFFVVEGPGGPLYTRNGSFNLSREGDLVTQDGYRVRVLDAQGRPVKLDRSRSIDVDRDGAVKVGGRSVGRIQIADFDEPAALSKKAGTYFHMPDPARLQPRPGKAEVYQGRLESSNVSAPETAVRLINVMRHFESLTKALQIHGEMGRRVLEEVARPS